MKCITVIITKGHIRLAISLIIVINITMYYLQNDISDDKHLIQTILPVFQKVICTKLIQGNENEINVAHSDMKKCSYSVLPDEYFLTFAHNCSKLDIIRTYYTHTTVSTEEVDFPLAFIILMYKEVEQTFRLLRAIYRPQNWYCIHVDLSASKVIHDAIDVIASCYDNVIVVSKKEDVIYGHISRLRAEINCMSDLLRINKKWKYVLNLPSQQFPVKTNAEIVEILKTYNGSNIIEGIINPRRMLKHRYVNQYKLENGILVSKGEKTPFKYNNTSISIVKGSAIGIFSKNFVKFILESELAKELLQWMRDIHSPDEYFWATLNHNEAIPAPGNYVTQKITHSLQFLPPGKVTTGVTVNLSGIFVSLELRIYHILSINRTCL